MALPYSFVMQRGFELNILQVQVPVASDYVWPWDQCAEGPVHTHRGGCLFPPSSTVVATVTKKPNRGKCKTIKIDFQLSLVTYNITYLTILLLPLTPEYNTFMTSILLILGLPASTSKWPELGQNGNVQK